MKRLPIFGLAAVAVILIAAVVAWRVMTMSPSVPPAPRADAAPPPATATAPTPARPSSPSFDIVRVNPQGETVIAGRAAPGAEVTVLDGDRELGRVIANQNGEWVLVPPQPLSPGDHQLSLSARGAGNGAPQRSDSVVAVLVPERAPPTGAGTPGQPSDAVAVLVPRQGAGPARLLQAPRGGAGQRRLSLDVIEYDAAGKVQLFGRAEGGARIEAYLDGRRAGTGTSESAGDWSVTLGEAVPVGRYALRLEALGAGGQKLAQLALTFSRVAPPEGAVAVDIQPGNNLWRIAQRSYGDGLRYTEIFQANRAQISDPNLIYPGQVFAVPAGH